MKILNKYFNINIKTMRIEIEKIIEKYKKDLEKQNEKLIQAKAYTNSFSCWFWQALILKNCRSLSSRISKENIIKNKIETLEFLIETLQQALNKYFNT